MTDSVANIPVKIVPEVDLSSFDRGLLKAQKSLGSILADIPERTNPRGRFRGSSSGDYIKASTYRDTIKNWVKAYETAPKNKKYNLVNSALEEIRENAPATSPFNIIKTFKGMFKDVGVDMPRSVMDNADVWKKQTQKNDKERIAREKKDSKNTEKQTKDLDSISSFIQKGALGFGMRLAPYAIAAKAASSVAREIKGIYGTRAVWGKQYDRSLEKTFEIMAGSDGAKAIQNAYAQYGNFKQDLEMGFVDSGMIKRVALATRGNQEAMEALMSGDTAGFIESVMNQAMGMEQDRARAMLAKLFPEDVTSYMKIWKRGKKEGGPIHKYIKEYLRENDIETSGEDFSEFMDDTSTIFRFGKVRGKGLIGNALDFVVNQPQKNLENLLAKRKELQDVLTKTSGSSEYAQKFINSLPIFANDADTIDSMIKQAKESNVHVTYIQQQNNTVKDAGEINKLNQSDSTLVNSMK